MAGQLAIYDATLACHHVFRDLVAVPILEEWAENCLADLNLWANGAGALKVGKASLDARLSSNLDAKNFVVNLLRMLQAFAEKCVELGREMHSDIPETSELSQAIQDVKYIIGQLSRITVSIRKAGTNARIQKADASYDPHHPQIEALSLHLQLLLLAKPSRNGALQAKKTSAQGMLLVSCIDDKPVVDSYSLTAIQQRLIEANLKRRNRFLYAQRHAMKLRERDQVPSTSIPTPRKLPSPPVLNTLKRTAEKHEVPKVNSTTTATEVQDPIPLPTQATTQPATTVISAISSRVTYPKPPPVRSDRNVFRCPCCCQTLSTSMSGGSQWKKHLSKDILPYTCILEDCPYPEKLYQTKHLWLSHMFTDHGGISHWACLACNDSSERPVFYEQSAFTKHLEGTHSRGIKPHQIPMLVSAWQRKTSVAIRSCPICGFEDQDSDVVLNHAAEHLHSFSLRALPWAPGEGESGGDLYDGYFEENPYFNTERSIDRESERSCSTMLSEQRDLEELSAMGSGLETTENNQLTEENIRDLLTNPNVEDDMLDAFLNGVENQESPQEPSALAITNLASTVLESRSSSVAGSVNERPASIISSLPPRSNPSPAASNTDVGDEGREKRQCPWPDCGRSFKDLKAHMLTHQDERPEKCPIVNCEYHIKGFARKNDRNRHTLTHYKGQMVCGFCPNAGLAAEKIFNRADVFKRHLISIHGVGQTEFNYRKRSPISSSMEQQKPLPGYSEDATGKCSTCSTTFSNAQDFYEHLDDCILRAVQQEEPSEAINQKRLAEVANDEDVKLTLEKHNLLYTGFTDDGGIFEGADYGAVKMLIEKGAAAYNKTSGDGSTLLSLAARRGDEAVVKVLIEKGAIVDSVDTPYGRTPLSWAAENGHDGVVKLLIEKGAAVDSVDKTGLTPLSWAAQRGHEAVVKVLIEKGAAVDSVDTNSQTPLSWAAENGHDGVVKVLIEKGAAVDLVDTNGRTPLSWAARGGHEAVVKVLIEKGAAAVDSVDTKYGWTPLLWAAENGHEAVVKVLIEKGAAVDSVDTPYGQTPLSWAAENGHDGVVKVLIEKGAAVDSVDTNGRTPLSWAARGGHEAVVKVLIEKGAAVDSVDTLHGQTPLSWAARRGHEAVVKVLIEKGAAVDSVDTPYGRTPLLWAAENGHEAVAKVLIEKGTAVDLVDTNGLTPLSWAARRGHEAVVKVLIEKGATVDSVDTNGQTPLSWAAENGHEAVAKVLIEKGAAVSWAVVN